MKTPLAFLLILASCFLQAQITPEIYSWILTDGSLGYGNIPSNVQQVQYSTDNVYVQCTCIPGYDIGPWTGNPNTPANQNFTFKITRNPQQNTGTLTATGLGHTGVWSNGVSIFNARDAFSYNSQGVWNQDALPNEGASFDDCLGHPAPNGEYHHHINPTCLYDDEDDTHHSPIIGYAFDGFPIYGAYAYADTNGTGAITRMRTSYRLRNITQRTSLPDGTVLSAGQYGPAVSVQYPLGKYLEDYEYVQSLGDLDAHNGRFCVTPDYPNGIYAYFVTIDSLGEAVYPYIIGPYYYGTVQPGNTGPNSGHNVISETVTSYNPATSIGFESIALENIRVYPNPTAEKLFIQGLNELSGNVEILITDFAGKKIMHEAVASNEAEIDFTHYPEGIYGVVLKAEEKSATYRIVKLD